MAEDDPKDKPEDTGGAGSKDAVLADLARERKARQAAEKTAKDLEDRLKGLEDRDKSETEKATESAQAEKKRADAAEAKLLRLTIGIDKGLTVKQANRLVGDTREELEADADDLVDTFKPADGDGKQQRSSTQESHRPQENLRGGGDPTQVPEETDPAKLAAAIPRN